MIINITHRNEKTSPAVKAKIESWLNHRQERYDIINSVQVTIDSLERGDEIEATLHTNGKEIYAKSSGDNLFSAIDSLIEKIDRQLAKAKGKMNAKKGGPRHLEPVGEILVADTEPEIDMDILKEYEHQA